MKIFICCDGTWNTKDNPTNVRKFFDLLIKGPVYEREKGIEVATDHKEQIACYMKGVGTNWYDTVRGGFSGWGISASIRKAYQFLMEYVKNTSDEQPDQIFLIGFSRGAFAARSIAGMIIYCGLLECKGTDDEKRVKFAYKCYRKRQDHLPHELKETTRNNVKIHFVGVWDTVGALGIPIWGRTYRILGTRRPHDVQANKIISHAYHAIGVDEQRAAYAPVLWQVNEDDKPDKLEQVWFRGVHSDIGGGYPEYGLANITLDWLVSKARDVGAEFDEVNLKKLLQGGEKKLHNSLESATWMAGVWPRQVPFARTPEDKDSGYNPSFGYLHDSVVAQTVALDNKAGGGQPLQWLEPGCRVTVSIDSRYWWNTTGVVLEANEEYRLSAQGSWIDRTRQLGPEGEDRSGLFWLKVKRALRYPGARWFELIGTVAAPHPQYVRSEFISKAFQYLVIRDPAELRKRQFRIGAETIHKPKETGILSCFANDLWQFYWNNKGSVQLTITRMT